MARRPTPGARERILDKASGLFAEHGINAVGLQQVIDECGCGKNLLYREFPSKDELVVAYLERLGAESRADSDMAIASHPGDPAAQLVEIVRIAVTRATTPDYRGCAFHNAAAEFREPEHRVHQVSIEHASAVRGVLKALAKQAGVAAPAELADRLMLIIEGVYASGTMFGRRGPTKTAVALAGELVHNAVRAGDQGAAS
jgi:AcrR family transcriptional regulator